MAKKKIGIWKFACNNIKNLFYFVSFSSASTFFFRLIYLFGLFDELKSHPFPIVHPTHFIIRRVISNLALLCRFLTLSVLLFRFYQHYTYSKSQGKVKKKECWYKVPHTFYLNCSNPENLNMPSLRSLWCQQINILHSFVTRDSSFFLSPFQLLNFLSSCTKNTFTQKANSSQLRTKRKFKRKTIQIKKRRHASTTGNGNWLECWISCYLLALK